MFLIEHCTLLLDPEWHVQLNALSEAIPTAEQEQQLMLSVSGQTQELQDTARRRAAVQHQPFSALHNCACVPLKK